MQIEVLSDQAVFDARVSYYFDQLLHCSVGGFLRQAVALRLSAGDPKVKIDPARQAAYDRLVVEADLVPQFEALLAQQLPK